MCVWVCGCVGVWVCGCVGLVRCTHVCTCVYDVYARASVCLCGSVRVSVCACLCVCATHCVGLQYELDHIA